MLEIPIRSQKTLHIRTNVKIARRRRTKIRLRAVCEIGLHACPQSCCTVARYQPLFWKAFYPESLVVPRTLRSLFAEFAYTHDTTLNQVWLELRVKSTRIN